MMSRGFREKPDLATAETFLQSGRFFWNAASSCSAPGRDGRRSSSGPQKIAQNTQGFPPLGRRRTRRRARRDRGQCHRSIPRPFASSPKVSGSTMRVMENANASAWSRPVRLERSGVLEPLTTVSVLDEAGNARSGTCWRIDVANSYLRSEDRLLAVAGLEQHHVVSTARRASDRASATSPHLVKDIATSVDHRRCPRWPSPIPAVAVHSPRGSEMAVRHRAAAVGRRRASNQCQMAACRARSIMTAAPADLGFKRLRVLARQNLLLSPPMPNSMGWDGGARGGPDPSVSTTRHHHRLGHEDGGLESTCGNTNGTVRDPQRGQPMTSALSCWRSPGCGARPNGPRPGEWADADESPIWNARTWSNRAKGGFLRIEHASRYQPAPIRTCIISSDARPG